MSIWKFIFRISIGTALVFVLLHKHDINFTSVFAKVCELPVGYLFGAVALYVMGQLLCSYRWAWLSTVGGSPAEFDSVWPVYFSGMFFNMCLPTSIGGDVVRVVGLGRKTGSKTRAAASVFMDRNIGLAGLLAVGLAASLVTCLKTPASLEAVLLKNHIKFPIWPLFLALICGYVLANMVLFSDGFCHFVTHFITRVKFGSLGTKIEKLHTSLQVYRQPLGRYVWSFLVSLIYQGSEIAAVWLLARGMGIELSAWAFCALVPFQAVACLLPVTFNGMGIREFIFCAVLKGQLGDTELVKGQALALSLLFFGVVAISSLIGGVVYMLSGMARPSIAEAEAVPGSAAGQ